MSKRKIELGTCDAGHKVSIVKDLVTDEYSGQVEIELINPLPDGNSSDPIVIACRKCAIVINNHIFDKSESENKAIKE